MLITKIPSGSLKFPDIWTKNPSGNLQRVRYVFTKTPAGALECTYGGNIAGININDHHPWWRYTLNSEFNENEGAVPTFNTFWSNNNAGTYSISGGNCQVQIPSGAITTTVVAGSAGYYVTSSESKQIFCNFTINSKTVVTFSNGDLTPLTRTDVQTGLSVPWTIAAFSYTSSGTTVTGLIGGTTGNQFTISDNAKQTGGGVTATLSRTWKSAYVPPTSGYNQYTGYCRLQSNYGLRVNAGHTYRLEAYNTDGTTNSTTWSMGILTNTTEAGADFFQSGVSVLQSPTYSAVANQTHNFTIPTGHSWARPVLSINLDTGTSGTYPSILPRQYTYNAFRFVRIS